MLAHGRALLDANDTTTVVAADLRRPADLLANADVRRLVEFGKPVGILLIAMTHFLAEHERESVMSTLRGGLAPGSFVALTHVTGDGHSAEAVEGVEAVYRATPTPIYFRSHAEILRFFDGFELVEPGLVTVDAWRPDPADPAPERTGWLCGGVARLPG